jgi:hypothetical protein
MAWRRHLNGGPSISSTALDYTDIHDRHLALVEAVRLDDHRRGDRRTALVFLSSETAARLPA